MVFIRSACFDPSSGQPLVNPGKREGGGRQKNQKIGEFSFRGILQPTTVNPGVEVSVPCRRRLRKRSGRWKHTYYRYIDITCVSIPCSRRRNKRSGRPCSSESIRSWMTTKIGSQQKQSPEDNPEGGRTSTSASRYNHIEITCVSVLCWRRLRRRSVRPGNSGIIRTMDI